MPVEGSAAERREYGLEMSSELSPVVLLILKIQERIVTSIQAAIYIAIKSTHNFIWTMLYFAS